MTCKQKKKKKITSHGFESWEVQSRGPAGSLSVMADFLGGLLFPITSQSGKEAQECLHKL